MSTISPKDGKRYYIDENGVEQAGAPNGWYDTATGDIYIDLYAGNDGRGAMLFTVAHELTHFMRQWSPDKFQKLAEYVFRHSKLKGKASALVAAKMEGGKLSYDEAYEEVVADAMESILTSGNVMQQMMADIKANDRTLWEKICDWFRNLVADLKELVGAYEQDKADSVEGRMVADSLEDVIRTLEGIYTEGLLDAAQNYQAAGAQKNTTQEDGVAEIKNSIRRTRKMTLKEQLSAYYGKQFKQSDSFYFGNTPSILSRSNLDALPLAFSQDDFLKSTKGKHNIPRRVLKNLHQAISRPIFTFTAGKQVGIMTSEIDGDGKPVVVAIHGGHTMDREPINAIKSIYGVESIEEWVEKQIAGGCRFRVYDIEKANAMLQTQGYLAAVGTQSEGFWDIITKIDPVVNPKSDETVDVDATGIKYSSRKPQKTFRKDKNAKGEFTVEVLIDLADKDSEWWTGGYNYAILGMNKADGTEFRQFYQQILKRTKDMAEYGEEDRSAEDSFTVQDSKGKEYIYVVKLDGYLHGVVLGKIDKAKYEAALRRETKGGANGKSVANIKRRTRTARSGVGRSRPGNGRDLASDGSSGHGGLGGRPAQSDMAGNDDREGSADQEVSTVTDPAGVLKQEYKQNHEGKKYSPRTTDFTKDFDYSGLNWAKELGIITGKDAAIFERTINNEILRGAKPHSANGEYILDTGRCLMFTDGDFHSPTLSRVIVFETEYESLTDDARRRIVDEAGSTGDVQESLQVIEDLYGPGFAVEYTQEVYGPNAWQKRGRKGTNRKGGHQGYRAKSLRERLEEEGLAYLLDDDLPDEPDSSGGILKQQRQVESVSNRSLLANALEAAITDETERKRLQEYKQNISEMDAQEQKLRELNARIKELSFAKGKRDTEMLRQLKDEAVKTKNRLDIYDKRLLRLEAAKPLQDVLNREKQKAYDRAAEKGRKALAEYRETALKAQRETAAKWQESRKKGIESRNGVNLTP